MGLSHNDAAAGPPPTLFLGDDDVAALTEWPAAIAALREAYPTYLPSRLCTTTLVRLISCW